MSSSAKTPNEKMKSTGRQSIEKAYEDKLSYTKGQPMWKTWVESKPFASTESGHDKTESYAQTLKERVLSKDVKFEIDTMKIGTMKIDSTKFEISATKFRDIRCCKCVGNVHIVEKTEEILDLLRNCCYTCSTNLLNTLPHVNKKKRRASVGKDFNFESQDFAKNYPGKTVTTKTPPYQRKRFYSQIERTAYHNRKPIERLSNHNSTLSSEETVSLGKSAAPAHDCELDSKQDLAVNRLENRNIVKETNDLQASVAIGNLHNVDKSGNRFVGALAVKNGFEISNQLVYSYHRSLLAAGKMKQYAGKKPVRVYLLNGESILLVFDPKALVKEVFEQVCSMHAIKESHFFGLSAIVENEHRFMDLKQKLSKYAPKEWGKELRRKGSDLSVQPSSIFTIQFQVQYYVEHPKLICDEESRHHYYLQLKRNVLQSKVIVQDELIFTLAAVALHLDLGPFDPSVHKGHYFDPHDYVPAWFLKKWNEDYLWLHLPTMHEQLVSTLSFQALADYIKQASTIDDVPIHYYKLFKTKREAESSVVMGIFHEGIRIHHVAQQGLDGPHLLDFEFPWNKVGRLFFAGKRFEIYPEDQPVSRKLIYYTGSKSRSKYLLRLLRNTHSLYMSLSPFVDHMRKIDGKNDRRKYRESYISGQNLEEKLGGADERLVGEGNKQSVGNCVFTYQSSLSNGSSRASGVGSGSDVKHGIDDVIEVEDDNAFASEPDSTKILKPSSGCASTNAHPHLKSQSSAISNTTASEPMAASENDSEKENAASGREFSAENRASDEKDVSSKLLRDGSEKSNKILLGTYTMSSRTATLKKNSVASNLDVDPSSKLHDLTVEADSSKKSVLEDTIASLLHDSNLDPPFSGVTDSRLPIRGSNAESLNQEAANGSSSLLASNAEKKRKPCQQSSRIHGDVTDSLTMLATHSNDSAVEKDGGKRPRHKKSSSGHRHHKSLLDATPSETDLPSGKHFGAPLTLKKSVEDLTATSSSQNNSTLKLDINRALKVSNHGPHEIGSAPSSLNQIPPFDKGPIVAVSWNRFNGTDTTVPRRSRTNTDEQNRISRRRSDMTGMSTPDQISNGFVPSSAGHTPGKPHFIFQNRKNRSRVSYQVYSEVDIRSNPVNGFCKSVPTNIHSPLYIEDFTEVIV